MRAAAIDIGTNTLKLTVGEVDPSGHITVLADERLGARLGEGVDANDRLSIQSQHRALKALRVLLGRVHDIGIDKLRVVATSAMRDAANRDEFIRLVQDDLSVKIEVLSEQDEALFSYRAVAMDTELGSTASKCLVVDIGGGSTELSVGQDGYVLRANSLKIGAVRLTERYLKGDPPTVDQITEASVFTEKIIRSTVCATDLDKLIGVGGTVVNVAAIVNVIPVERYIEVHGLRLTREQVRDSLSILSSLPLNKRQRITGLEPDRADVIIGGALIVDRVMEVFNASGITVSTRGLRYGVLYTLLEIGS